MIIHEKKRELVKSLAGIYDNREAQNIADLVIENLTDLSRTDQLKRKELALSQGQIEKLDQIVNRLRQNEPVQYILGEAWFAGLKFLVDKNVLIPRPETEEMVDWIVKDQYATGNRQISILDIGTGSGCISISLKKKLPLATVTAVDVCSEALFVAANNSIQHGTEVDFMLLDFLNRETWIQLKQYDVIVSNPPYIRSAESKEMHDRVTGFEPALALFVPDNDALIFYKAISEFGKKHLKTDGVIYVEIHESRGNELINVFREWDYSSIELRKDMQGKERLVKVNKLMS